MDAQQAVKRFSIAEVEELVSYGNGHINETYKVRTTDKEAPIYILQKVNRYVFKKPEQVMANIERVTEYLRGIIAAEGGDPVRGTMTLIPTHEGTTFFLDENEDLWRMYVFIPDTISRDLPDTEELFKLSGTAFGKFQRQMDAFDASTLYETIPDFHNTPARYQQLMDAVAENAAGRLGEVEKELAFCKEREPITHILLDALNAGEIPMRVTHNDTKLNNVLLDAKTGEAVCVIDLDTVMPGLAAYDFGESERFGSSTAAEDETDLDKVGVSLSMYKAFAEGYLEECGSTLNQREIELLSTGVLLMTLENGMRFLADYLNGDKYFRIHRPKHNLDRAHAMFKLVTCLESLMPQLNAIVADCASKVASKA